MTVPIILRNTLRHCVEVLNDPDFDTWGGVATVLCKFHTRKTPTLFQPQDCEPGVLYRRVSGYAVRSDM